MSSPLKSFSSARENLEENEQLYWQWKELPPGPEKELAARRLHNLLKGFADSHVYLMFHRADPGLSADIVSRAFLKESQFAGDSKFQTWFYRLARNVCLNALKKQNSRREVPLGEELSNPSPGSVDAELLLAGLLRSLPDGDSRLLLREKVYGTENLEIAEMLGVNRVVLKQRWKRLKKRLLEQQGAGFLHLPPMK